MDHGDVQWQAFGFSERSAIFYQARNDERMMWDLFLGVSYAALGLFKHAASR